MKIVIIGFGAGAVFAASTLRKYSKDDEIVIIDKKDYDLLHSCSLPFVINQTVPLDSVKHNSNLDITKMHKHEALKINPNEKYVHVKNMETNEEYNVDYDKLIIATGADTFVPPIEGLERFIGKGAFFIDSAEHTQQFIDYIQDKNDIVVVGAGAIGLETSAGAAKLGKKVTVVEMLPYSFPKALDQDIAEMLQQKLEEKGISFMFNSKLEKVNGSESISSVIVNGNEIRCDALVLASGVRANTKIAEDSGIEIGKWGIKTNEHMQTNFEDIYAIGDVAQIRSIVDGRDWMMQVAVAAYKQATVAALHILGKNATYKGATNAFVSVISGIEVSAVGFNSHAAGENIVVGKATSKLKPEWFPDNPEMTIKIIADKETKKILGAQAIGYKASDRINVVSAAIKANFTVYDLSEVELAYCPEITDVYDVLMKAADNAIRKFEVLEKHQN